MKLMLRLAALILSIMTVDKASAQEAAYRWEVGANTGLSGYLGDYNQSNPLAHPGARLAVWGSHILDARWSFRLQAGVSGISGNSDGIGGALPADAVMKFRSTLGDLTARAEFNFLPFGEGETFKHLSRWTPYVAAGVGMVVAVPRGANVTVAPLVPMALGVKVRLKPRLNLWGEFSMAKSFTDGLDGNADLYGIKGSWLKNTDWMSILSVGVSYEFGERCPTCHYYD